MAALASSLVADDFGYPALYLALREARQDRSETGAQVASLARSLRRVGASGAVGDRGALRTTLPADLCHSVQELGRAVGRLASPRVKPWSAVAPPLIESSMGRVR